MPSDDEDPSSEEAEETYEVERILAQDVYDGKTVYLVKWRGYPDEECTWEPAEHFSTPDTLIEWKRQYEMGDFLNDQEVETLHARMRAWTHAREEEQRKKAEEKRSRARAKGTSRIPPIAQPQKSRSGSAEPPSKRPRLQNQAALSQQEPDTKPHNTGSRIPSTFHKKGIATVTKRSTASSTTHTALAGARFKNLRHQNNFAKRSRLEPAPDVSKLDLRAPNEFVKDTHATAEARKTPPKARDDSPLFVPEMTPSDSDEVVRQSITAMPQHPIKPTLEPPTGPPIEPPTKPPLEPSTEPPIEPSTKPPVEPSTKPPVEPPTKPPVEPSTKPPVEPPTEPPVEPSTEAPPEPPPEPQPMRSVGPLPEPPSYTSSRPASIALSMRQTSPDPAKANPVESNSISQPRSLVRPHMTTRDSFAAPYKTSEVPDSDSDIRTQIPPRPTMIARNGRAWNKGDLVVHLRFGDHTVGDVKILHLPGKIVANMVTLKSPHELILTIQFQECHVIKRTDFINKFESNLERFTYALGAIEPYEDTSQAVASLAEHLESNNLGAVWEWPNDVEGFVMILYSLVNHGYISWPETNYQASVWTTGFPHGRQSRSLSKASTTASDAVAQYNGMTTKGHVTRRPSNSTSQRDILPRIATERNASIPKHHGAYVGSPSEAPTMSKDRCHSTRSPRTPMTPGSPSQQCSRLPHDLKDQVAMAMSSRTKLAFSANFRELVSSDREKKRPVFYIAFARSHPAEAQAVTRWLTGQPSITARHIFADTEKNAWGEMREEIDSSKTKHGIVLFLEGTQAYCDLRSLAKWVREVSCFSISFQQPEGSLGGSISRLFPKGMVMFITESTMVEFPKEVLFLLEWFEEQCRLKPKSRKLGLIPNVKDWIVKNCWIRGRNMENVYRDMLVAICRLEIRALAAWDSSSQNADPDRYVADVSPSEDDLFLLSVPNLPGYGDVASNPMELNEVAARDRILIQYFCGWAALRVGKYKSFDLLDEHQTNEMVPHSWHVAFRKPRACVEAMKRSN